MCGEIIFGRAASPVHDSLVNGRPVQGGMLEGGFVQGGPCS